MIQINDNWVLISQKMNNRYKVIDTYKNKVSGDIKTTEELLKMGDKFAYGYKEFTGNNGIKKRIVFKDIEILKKRLKNE